MATGPVTMWPDQVCPALKAEIEHVDLVQALDVSLRTDVAARTDFSENTLARRIGRRTLESDHKKLAHTFFNRQA